MLNLYFRRTFSIFSRCSCRIKVVSENEEKIKQEIAQNTLNDEELNRRDQSAKTFRPKVNPIETTIILFPGQGSQYVGMGKNLLKFPGARDIYELANEVLKYDLLKICQNGPKNILDKTVHSQLAIFVTSLAALEKLREERPNAIEHCIATAGFSLGEITALTFAGSLRFVDALKLVRIRAEAMQFACDQTESGMATVIYRPDSSLGKACEKAKEWCQSKGIENPECKVSSYLYPHCKVIAGNIEALKYIETNLELFKLRKISRLPVNGAFHTSLMSSAVDPFREALKNTRITDPLISVHSNIDGKIYKHSKHIFTQLPKQIIHPVMWEQTMHILYERKQGTQFPRTFECGPGKGLTAILNRNNAKAYGSAFNVEA